MKKNILKGLMALSLCGLLTMNINELFGRPYGIGDVAIKGRSDGTSIVCSAGGPGSSSCSTSSTLSGDLGSSGGSISTSCTVTCNSGYYACCNNFHNTCKCKKES